MRFVFLVSLFVLCLKQDTLSSNTITSKEIGISITLPVHWKAYFKADTHVVFKDTLHNFSSQISIKKHIRSSAINSWPIDWTRSHFLAYLLVVKSSFDPAGAVLYFDSSARNQINEIWSPEAFSQFYTTDTSIGAWNEYLRFAATGPYGFEIYALGDTTDMKKNIDYYAGIISTIRFSDSNLSNTSHPQYYIGHDRKSTFFHFGRFNLLGICQKETGKLTNGLVLTNKKAPNGHIIRRKHLQITSPQ